MSDNSGSKGGNLLETEGRTLFILLLIVIAVTYKQTIGAPVIETIGGAEWEYLTVEGAEYEIDYSNPQK